MLPQSFPEKGGKHTAGIVDRDGQTNADLQGRSKPCQHSVALFTEFLMPSNSESNVVWAS
jgi:hypothetical protein